MAAAQQKVDDLQRQLHEHSQDKSEDLYWGVHRMYQQAVIDLHELHQRVFGKVFNQNEPRDEKGRWTAGDSPSHPDWMHGEEGSHLASAMEDVPKGINESADHIEEARQALEDSSATGSDHSEEEPDSGTKEYAAWEKQNNVNLNDVADKTMALHQAIVDHMDATAGVLSQLRGRIAIHASENGIRMGKSMTVGDVHATTALGNQPTNKRKAKDFLTTIVEVKGARVVAMPAMDFGKALRMIKAGPEDEPRDEHGRWTDGGDKNMPPNRVQPPHQVTDSAHFNDLVSSMKENGWQGRPILAIDLGNGIEALTGSHRIAAAQEADLDKIPVKFIEPGVLDYEDNDGYTFRDRQTMGDEELAAFLREAGDRKSAALMDEEVRTQKIGINRNSAMDFDKALSFIKAGPADEARDYHGRWTADGDDPTTPPFPQSQYGSDRVISTIQNKISRGVEPVLTWKFDTKGQPIPIPIEWGKNRIAPNFIAYWSLEKRTVNVLFMRHGPTRFNNQTDMSKDRVRSWNNVPLTAEGIEDAEKAGEKLKDEGIGYIVSSDLGRAIRTAKLVGKAVGVKPIHEYRMLPWNLGKF